MKQPLKSFAILFIILWTSCVLGCAARTSEVTILRPNSLVGNYELESAVLSTDAVKLDLSTVGYLKFRTDFTVDCLFFSSALKLLELEEKGKYTTYRNTRFNADILVLDFGQDWKRFLGSNKRIFEYSIIETPESTRRLSIVRVMSNGTILRMSFVSIN